MIPDLTLSALENGFGHFGVASNNNKTRHVDTLGVNVDSKNSTLTCYVKNDETKEVLEFLNESGRISFFVGMITHEAYNFKGQFVEVINLSRDDLEASNIYRNKIIDTITSIGMSKEGALSKYGIIPDIGIKFKVDKVFVQTPGPDAGKEIVE